MKKFNIIRYGVLFILPLMLFSCNNWIDTDLNVDPDSPTDVPMEYLVPSIQASMAYVAGGNTSVRVTNIWMQYFDGVDRQSLAQGRYNINSADVNDLWESLYAQAMMDCKTLMDKAVEKESPHYAGVAKVCMATCLGTLTNLYGDLPYSEAFQGNSGILQPAYESQEAIYGHIEDLLTSAITDLASEDNAVALGSDLIFDGSTEKWAMAANALLARYSLYKKDYATALTYVDNAFASNDDDFGFAFINTTSGSNPLFQFMRDRTDIRMSSTFIDELVNTADPRLAFYSELDLSGAYSGSTPGSENSAASHPGAFVAAAEAPVYLATFAEMKFVAAECNFQTGATADAIAAYQEGITASLEKVTGATDSTYMADYVDNVTTITIEDIIMQKYKADYGTVLAYDDWRRTGFPELVAVDGATKATPVRFPYPQSEIVYNQNCPVGVQLSDKLWIFQ